MKGGGTLFEATTLSIADPQELFFSLRRENVCVRPLVRFNLTKEWSKDKPAEIHFFILLILQLKKIRKRTMN